MVKVVQVKLDMPSVADQTPAPRGLRTVPLIRKKGEGGGGVGPWDPLIARMGVLHNRAEIPNALV